MNKPVAPCKDCKNRYLGCHSECKGYIQFLEDKQEWDRMVRDEKDKAKLTDTWSYSEYNKRNKNRLWGKKGNPK